MFVRNNVVDNIKNKNEIMIPISNNKYEILERSARNNRG